MNVRALFGLALLACSALSCNRSTSAKPAQESEAAATGIVRASGSSALLPLVNAAKEHFESEHQGVSVELSAGGSKRGLADVASGAVHIGNSDIPAPEDLAASLVDHKVAVVGFAIVANRGPFNEKVSKVDLDQLARIFRGQLTNWSELGGESQPIVLINRAVGSGTRAVVGSIVLGSDDFVEARTEDNSGALVAKLKGTRGALSYVSLSYVDDELLTLALETKAGIVAPSAASIRSGQYPLFSYEHMYTRGEPSGSTKAFLDYVLSPAFQREVLPKVKGFLPAIDMNAAASQN